MDERFCTICQEPIHTTNDLEDILFENQILCPTCQALFKKYGKTYDVYGALITVLYVYTEAFERIIFQYKENCDIALAPVFLYPYKEILIKELSKYQVCGLCSSNQKTLSRGFDPLSLIYESIGIELEHPFYKTKEHKQSHQSKTNRAQVKDIIKRKSLYALDLKKPICLVDDVLTTGASIQAALKLVLCHRVIIIAGHPKWLEEHEKDLVNP